MQTNEAQLTTAADLVAGHTESIPVKKPRVPWPTGVKIEPTYPGSKVARHPVTKAFVKIDEAIRDGGVCAVPAATAEPAKPAEIKAEEKPQPIPQPEPQPTAAPSPEPRPQPTATETDKPKFDDTATGPDSQAQPGAAEASAAMASHEAMGGMFHGVIENILVMGFGQGFKTADTERAAIVKAWVRCLEFWNARILNPVEQLAAAYGCYLFGRITVVFDWLKARKARKVEKVARDVVQSNISREKEPKPEPEKKPDAKSEPVIDSSETTFA